MRLKTSPQSQRQAASTRKPGTRNAVETAIRMSKGNKSRKWEIVAPRVISRWPSPKTSESSA